MGICRGVLLAVHLAALGWAGLALPAARAGAPPPPLPPPLEPSGDGQAEAPTREPSATPNKPEPAKEKESGEAKTTESGDSLQARMNFSEGLVAETKDKAFRFHVGGRFDFDSGWYDVSNAVQQSLTAAGTPLLDGTDMRRFRLGFDGTCWEQVDFKVEADFSRASDFKSFKTTPQTNLFITDAWIAVRDLPLVDTVRAGHQKEYLTFSNATSAKFQPFMERPYIFDAFENNFSWDNGVSLTRTYFDQQMTSWAGIFWNGTRSQAFNVAGHYALSGRLTWAPIYNEDEQRWLNFGVSGSTRAVNNDPNFVTVRPLVRTGQSFDVPNLLSTPALLNRDGLQILGVGVHSAWGPLSFGGEFLCWSVPHAFTGSLPEPNGVLPPGAKSVGNLFFSGFSVEALYFLTPGDHRPLNRVTPGYARVQPVHAFHWKRDDCDPASRGLGAWEVGIRYDHVDLNSEGIQAGVLDSVTVGVNWFLNANTRITTNYVYTFRDTGNPASSGSFDSLGLRFHFDF
jgi:phosphate-selective porin OprO/OprP